MYGTSGQSAVKFTFAISAIPASNCESKQGREKARLARLNVQDEESKHASTTTLSSSPYCRPVFQKSDSGEHLRSSPVFATAFSGQQNLHVELYMVGSNKLPPDYLQSNGRPCTASYLVQFSMLPVPEQTLRDLPRLVAGGSTVGRGRKEGAASTTASSSPGPPALATSFQYPPTPLEAFPSMPPAFLPAALYSLPSGPCGQACPAPAAEGHLPGSNAPSSSYRL